jgi:hypothetical protein
VYNRFNRWAGAEFGSKSSRRWRERRSRLNIKRCCCRPKDFRRMATRCDKLARNFFCVGLVVAVINWM